MEHLGFDAITAKCIPGVALEGHYQIKACKTDSTATPILSCDKMYLDSLASSDTLICNDNFFDLLMIWMPEASLLSRHICSLTIQVHQYDMQFPLAIDCHKPKNSIML